MLACVVAACLLAPGAANAQSPRSELAAVPDVAAACDATTLVRADGTVWSWGENALGQLGDGTTTSGEAPRQVLTAAVTPLTNVIAVARSCEAGYALRGDGSVWAWGSNEHGQLGQGSAVGPGSCGGTPCSTYAVRVTTGAGPTWLDDVTSIAAGGSFAIARRADGTAWSWGRGDGGQLGNGSTSGPDTCAAVGCSTRAIRVADAADPAGYLTSVIDVAATDAAAVALRVDGTLRAWGSNARGATGTGTTTGSTLVPVPVQQDGGGFPELDRVASIAGGGDTFLAVRSDGTVHAWGAGDRGQLGNASTTPDQPRSVEVLDPTLATPLTRIREVTVGGSHALAVRADGAVLAWGANDWGQLGDLSQVQRTRPVVVRDSTTPTDLALALHVAAGGAHSVAVLADGTVRSWGDDQAGQLGLAAPPPSCGARVCSLHARAASASVGSGYRAVAAASNTSYALAADGTVRAWGDNNDGQTGIGTEDGLIAAPRTVLVSAGTPLTGVIAISAGDENGIALRADGTVWSWGDGSLGQLGRGSSADSDWAVQVQAAFGVPLTDIAAIGGIDRASYFLGVDGRVRAVGRNTYGALGDDTTTDRSYPVLMQQLGGAPLADVVALSGRGGDVDSASFVRVDGTAWALGMNDDGQLGLGTSSGPSDCGGTDCSRQARQVQAASGVPFTGVVTLASSYYASHALTANGWLWSWGINERGEIGNATTSLSDVPYPVRVATNDTNSTWVERAKQVVSGDYSPLGILGDGTAIGWGSNTEGQLGDASLVSPRRYRTDVAGIGGVGQLGMVDRVEVGLEHGIARDAAGRVLTWGRDQLAQLGSCTTTYATRRFPDLLQETCAGNLPPTIDGAAAQYRSDMTTPLPIGTWTNETTITVRATVMDPDAAQSLRLFVEIRPNNVPFSAACGDTGDPAVFQSSASSPIVQGEANTRWVTVTGLTSGVQYHWRACTRDAGGTGLSSPFYTPEGNPDISIDTSTPAAGTYGVRQVAAGCDNTGVVLADGSVWMAGDGARGQLGNGTTAGSSMGPVQVRLAPAGATALTGVRELAIGCGFAMAVRTDGTVWAWGANDRGQLGAASATSCGGVTCSEWAVQVDAANVGNVKAIAAGPDFGLALRADGKVLAWGDNVGGQLGRGSVGGSSATAAPVRNTANTADLANITSIAAGDEFAVATDSSGAVWSWGCNDDYQLGAGLALASDHGTAQRVLAAAGTPLTRAKAVAAGEEHAFALQDDGTLRAWGSNGSGRLGINQVGGTSEYAIPVRDAGGTTLAGWTAMDGGWQHSIARRADGTTWTWGRNTDGELGTNGGASSNVPVQTTDSAGVALTGANAMFKAVAAGDEHTVALRGNGSVQAWGSHALGQLARTAAVGGCAGSCSLFPVATDFSTGTGAIAVDGADFGSAMLLADGTIRTWGDNANGELGNGTWGGQTPRLQTVEVSAGVPLDHVVRIGAGASTWYAIRADGTAWSWGYGSSGRLGNAGTGRRTRAVQVRTTDASSDTGPALVDVIDIAGHDQGGLAIDSTGTVWSWGDNDLGELGSGACCSSRDWAQPVLRSAGVPLDRAVALGALSADGDEAYAVRSDGTLWAWGANDQGQLGQGSAVGPDACTGGACSIWAIQVLAAAATPLTNVLRVGASDGAGYIVRGDGTVWAWGDGASGRLGNNATSDRAYPVQVRVAAASADTGTPLTMALEVAGGADYGSALDAAGRVLSWGYNSGGELADGSTSSRSYAEPVQAIPSTTVTGAYGLGDGGQDHGTIVLSGAGRAMTVGANYHFQLADCTRANRSRYDYVRDPCPGNLAPMVRWNIQYRNDHSTRIDLGEWVPDGITDNIYLDFNVSDPDSGETLTPYIEFAPLGTPFGATCGDTSHPSVRAGAPVAATAIGAGTSISFPVTGLTIGEQYHWRACVVDSSGSPSFWAHTGTSPNPDFGVDDQRPANPTGVDDGAERGVDIDTTTSLSVLEATWPFGIDGGGSGLVRYDYCVTTSATGADCGAGATRTWTSNGYSADLRATGLSLTHNTTYHVCVRANDGAGNQALGHVCSDGQLAWFALTAVNPNAGVQGDTGVTLELTGAGFLATDAVTVLGGGITVQSVTRVSDTRLDVVVDIAPAATPGARTVQVAHTGSDTTQLQLANSFTVTALSITVSLSTLGHGDAARDAVAPHAVSLGTILPGDTRQLGPTGSGQTLAGAAAEVTVVSNGAWRLQHSASGFANGSGATIPASAMSFRHHSTVEAWTPFSTSATVVEGTGAGLAANAPGGTTFSYDWQLAVPVAQSPGAYTGTVTYTAIPAV